MLTTVFVIALICFSLSILILLYRVINGPSVPDRVIALDAMGINLVAIVAIVSMLLDTSAYLDVILLTGILSFIGTVSFSKFLERGEIIERDRDH
ncbi:Na(+)/H(+) antiporter subunit F1 [Bacillus chungangensis]|uniref:Multicomponent Na+:H+ antiporter subunit F n=1 Tax=Bacillus chungangensis TaxID=587633 RepID=A0ABT9WZG3_9BACI|nr:Na(+)/H(+) antiporter subunit F1 [Bacillus chungangensis]MDQ0178576.1 multicomponent Na+:H+ antiporter subunit F [Bacillus chungangensis]